MSKKKGSRTERELFYLFYESSWMPIRAAGSGSTPIPAPDLLVGNGKRVLAIECKAIKGTKKYFEQQQIQELLTFAEKFGAEPWIAIKFDYKGWFFLKPEELERTKNGIPSISIKTAQIKARKFHELIQESTNISLK